MTEQEYQAMQERNILQNRIAELNEQQSHEPMITEEDRDTDEPILAAPEAAYRRSNEYEWNGVKLHKFSHLRKTAAIALGLRCWKLTPADFETLENPKFTRLKKAKAKLEKLCETIPGNGGNPIAIVELAGYEEQKKLVEELETQLADESEEIEIYDGMGQDTAIVLWLCHQPDSKCYKARRKPREFEAEIDNWAEENRIFDGPMAQVNGDALGLFFQIVSDIGASEGQPDIKSEGNPDPN